MRTITTSATNESSEAAAGTTRSYPNYDINGLLQRDLQPGRIAHLILRPQPDFLYDRIQRAKMEKNNHNA